MSEVTITRARDRYATLGYTGEGALPEARSVSSLLDIYEASTNQKNWLLVRKPGYEAYRSGVHQHVQQHGPAERVTHNPTQVQQHTYRSCLTRGHLQTGPLFIEEVDTASQSGVEIPSTPMELHWRSWMENERLLIRWRRSGEQGHIINEEISLNTEKLARKTERSTEEAREGDAWKQGVVGIFRKTRDC